ncbi:MAG: hypothetical protein JXR63_02625 [Spirochaetales bacterium]|nr:hypothetical protein [Spirochaetales bacterium]
MKVLIKLFVILSLFSIVLFSCEKNPDPISDLLGKVDNGSVTLTWQQPENLGVEIWYGKEGEELALYEGEAIPSGTVISGLENGAIYHFEVYTVSSSGLKSAVVKESYTPADILPSEKQSAISAINSAFASYSESDYSSENWASLVGFKDDGLATVDSATTVDAVLLAKNTALSGMAGVVKLGGSGSSGQAQAQAFETNHAVVLAITAVTVADRVAVLAAISDFDDLSEDAKSYLTHPNANAEFLNGLKSEIEAIISARIAAQSAISSQHDSYNEDHYSVANYETLTSIRDTAYSDINGSNSVTEINEIKNIAISDMDNVETDALNAAIAEKDNFLATHGTTCNFPAATITPGSEPSVDLALADYDNLSTLAKSYVLDEKPKLDNLKSVILDYGRIGEWDFNHSDTWKATYGNDLSLQGSGSWNLLNATHWKYPSRGVGIDTGRFLRLDLSLASDLTSYTFIFDMKVVDRNWKPFYQTNLSNSEDGELWIKGTDPKGTIGVSDLGYSSNTVQENVWNRIVFVKAGSSFKIYVNGTLYLDSSSGGLGRFTISRNGVLFFADDNGEDTYVFITKVAFYSKALSDTQRTNLGVTMP